ncbi:MAG: hypothetical protein PHQ80_00240 [Candidatus ainarchaeum sp.]|nr:hypothetical protein [Candidatus ainarchaeum sp.]MDD5096315.1 hypothetical protein [Candidatus ainarchaeum sp.]
MILRYEKTRSQEESQKEQTGFPSTPQFPVPMLPHHYQALPQNHREQIIWTYVPHIRSQHNGDFSQIFTLNLRDRMRAYEKMVVLGHDLISAINNGGSSGRAKPAGIQFPLSGIPSPSTPSYPMKKSRAPSKDMQKVISFVEENAGVKAEDLVDFVPPRVFSRLMLYTKFAGNSQASLLAFFKNLSKE